MSTRRRSELCAGLVLACLLLACLLVGGVARADEDALAPYRDRFKAGMDRFRANDFTEAIKYWEPIYREIGAEQGYRLSFDLAQAYEQIAGESTRAAERYESFLAEVAKRRGAGEKMDARVEKEEQEARDALEKLKATKGRIEVNPGGRPILVQVDADEPRLGSFVAYKAPGNHVVTFAPGSTDAERREVTVKAGEIVDVAPKPAPAQPPPPPPGEETKASPPPPPGRVVRQTDRPFSPVVLYVAAGTTLLSTIVPIATYAHASSLLSTANGLPRGTHDENIAFNNAADSYTQARNVAYATYAIPLGLAAITVGLTLWYFAGTKERAITIAVPSAFVTPIPGGAAAMMSGSF